MSDDAILIAVGGRIRAARKSLRLTQQTLAEAIGYERTSIANIEAGAQNIPITTLYALAHALALPVNALLPESAEPLPDLTALIAGEVLRKVEVAIQDIAREYQEDGA